MIDVTRIGAVVGSLHALRRDITQIEEITDDINC